MGTTDGSRKGLIGAPLKGRAHRVPTGVMLDPDLLAKVDSERAVMGISRSEFVNRAVAAWFDRRPVGGGNAD